MGRGFGLSTGDNASEHPKAMSELIPVSGREDDTRRGDVIFVHGLGGNPRAYWCHEGKNENFWPSWLAEAIPRVGVWSYGYEAAWSGWQGNAMALPQRAQECLERLTLEGIGNRPLVFIAHSLGGLVIKYVLFQSLKSPEIAKRKIASSTRGICFLATPHQGADVANVISFFGGVLPLLRISESVRELRGHSPYLIEMNNDFRRLVQDAGIAVKIYCEMRPTRRFGAFRFLRGVVVVPQGSADPGLPNFEAVPTDDDHISICKPSSRSSPVFRGVCQFADRHGFWGCQMT
jgi:pimeloyl-ACP methyl ester carboxylesterase